MHYARCFRVKLFLVFLFVLAGGSAAQADSCAPPLVCGGGGGGGGSVSASYDRYKKTTLGSYWDLFFKGFPGGGFGAYQLFATFGMLDPTKDPYLDAVSIRSRGASFSSASGVTAGRSTGTHTNNIGAGVIYGYDFAKSIGLSNLDSCGAMRACIRGLQASPHDCS